MTRLRFDLKQYINEDYRYWYVQVANAIFCHFGRLTSDDYICVAKNNGKFIVSIAKKEDILPTSLAFRIPENYNHDTDYYLLQSWITQKLYNWYVQFKGKGESLSKHNS